MDARTRDAMTRAGLNLIQQALSIYDADLRLVLSNRRFQEMFDLPKSLITPSAPFADTIRHVAARGDYGPLDDLEAFVIERVEMAQSFTPHYMERTRGNGQVISVEGTPLPNGVGDRLYRHHPNQTTRGYVTRQIRGIIGAAKCLFPRTQYNKPQAGLDYFCVRTIATRPTRNRSAHTLNNRNDARTYRPCRTRSAIYLFEQTPKPCDAGTPRRHRKQTRSPRPWAPKHIQ